MWLIVLLPSNWLCNKTKLGHRELQSCPWLWLHDFIPSSIHPISHPPATFHSEKLMAKKANEKGTILIILLVFLIKPYKVSTTFFSALPIKVDRITVP